ncbi:MAG: hypothetical protein J1E98_00775 [Lachnospiraceae bacterium]|nr:hypothetical protein [Lachnospiraceae bacterium]
MNKKVLHSMTEKINRFSIKGMTACAAVLFVLSVMPLLLLGKYNVMCIDDYNYGQLVHDTWVASGSLKQSVLTAFEQVKLVYMTTQGAYTSAFLMAMCPMNFNYYIGFVVPVIMIGMFSVSSFCLGRQILTRWLGSDKIRAAYVMFILLFMFYQVIEAPFEGIYWYNGSVHYIFMESLLFIILTLVSYSMWSEDKGTKSVISCIAASVIAPITAGSNLVTALQAEVLLAFLLVYAFFAHKKRLLYVLIPYLTYTAGFLCNVLAPGHRARAEIETVMGYSPVMSVLLSFYYAMVFMLQWTTAFVILTWLSLLPVLWQIARKSNKNFRHPVLVTLGVYCIISAMFTPTLYGLGTAGLSRVDNIIQMVYYLSLILVTTYWLGWISHNANPGNNVHSISAGMQFGSFLESTKNMMTFTCLLLVMVIWVFTADKNTYAGISALRSLVIGDGKVYYEEAMERHKLYIDETIRDVEVKPLSMKPALFDFEDINEDSEYWLNLSVNAYFHKHYVRIVE